MTAKRILVAEDEVALRFLLTETLEEEGYFLEEAEDGAVAIGHLEQNVYDLIILDYMMPEKTGVEVCTWLRGSSNANKATPVVLLTAKAQDKDRKAAEEAGVTTYVTKPFSPLQLMDVVQDLLRE